MAMNDPRTTDNRALVSIEGQQSSIIPGKSEWSLMRDMAQSLVPTGFLPESIKTPEQAVAIMLKGRELNVPPMYALSNIAIVKGKPTISAEMMLALIYRDHGKRAIRVKESTNERCTVEYRLDGWDDVSSYSFTMDDAKKAGLTGNQTWSKYPAAMLRARCISAVARMAFPECIAGMYVPGELGDDVQVTDNGEVVSAAPSIDQDTGEIHEPGITHDPHTDEHHVNPSAWVGNSQQREPIRATAEIVDEPAQAPLVSDDDDRKKANAYAHATAEGLFGSKGHDVLHIMAMHAWGHDSLTKCTADQLRELGERLEAKADDEVAFNAWYDKWIAPYLVETDTEDAE